MQLPHKQHLGIILYRARITLAAENSRTYLSFLWWIIDPLLELCIFYFVFGLILQRGGPGFITELLTGIVGVRLFIVATNASPSLLLHNRAALLAINLPKYIFPAVHTVTCFFKFLFLLAFLCCGLLVMGVSPQPTALMLVPITLIYVLFTLGVCMLLCGITPFVPDFAMLYPKISMLLYWSSGVFFRPEAFLPERYLVWFYANPIASFIAAYRECLLHGTVNPTRLAYLFAISIFLLLLGYAFLAVCDKQFPRLVSK
ncbi:MAG: ABC transporter permease [Deltaproteobacteria bacterium]|jgi:lipopolysaccharide transport system permease protein|nr:ABC transporter permease [Deltaproteobacteria bacterium]